MLFITTLEKETLYFSMISHLNGGEKMEEYCYYWLLELQEMADFEKIRH